MLTALGLVGSLGACMIGDVEDPIDDSTGELRSGYAGDRLRWASLTSTCARPANIVSNGEALTVLFDQGTAWKACSFHGTLRVPADVRLRGLTQQVRTDGGSATLRYTAKVNGAQVTARTTTARGTLDAYANLAQLGDVLCRQPGGGDRYLTIAFDASVDGTGVALDSVDWAFAAANCD